MQTLAFSQLIFQLEQHQQTLKKLLKAILKEERKINISLKMQKLK